MKPWVFNDSMAELITSSDPFTSLSYIKEWFLDFYVSFGERSLLASPKFLYVRVMDTLKSRPLNLEKTKIIMETGNNKTDGSDVRAREREALHLSTILKWLPRSWPSFWGVGRKRKFPSWMSLLYLVAFHSLLGGTWQENTDGYQTSTTHEARHTNTQSLPSLIQVQRRTKAFLSIFRGRCQSETISQID